MTATMIESTDDDPATQADDSVAMDMLAGALAGAAAIWVLDRVDWFNYTSGYVDDEESRRQTEAARPGGMDPAHVVANRIARSAGVTPPEPAQQNPYGLAMHYGIGIGAATLYGALRDRVEHVDAGRGAAFGVSLFLMQDEAANALFGLSGRPRDYPWQAHARGLVAHVVYGLVTDALTRAMRPPRRRPVSRRRNGGAPAY